MGSYAADGSSFRHAAAITAHDSNNFAFGVCSAIYVGGAGVVPVVLQDGSVVNFTAAVGTIIPVRAVRVNATNLTASLLVGLY